MIIATGGMEKSGTNYTNYVMFLHPDLKVVNYPTPGEVKPGMGYKDIAKLHKYPIPMPAFIKNTVPLYVWHKEQEQKQEFRGVCFKYDRGETWYKDVFNLLPGPLLFIYCIRPLADVVRSWKNWGKDSYTDESFVSSFKGSVESVRVLRENPFIPYACMNVTESMDTIRSRFLHIHNKAGLEMGQMQKLFLEERRIIGGGGQYEKEESDEELLSGLYNVESGLDSWVSSYNQLLEEA